jgi:hypothetical protein
VRSFGEQNARHARDGRGGLRRSTRIATGDDDVDIAAETQRSGDRVKRRRLERALIVFGKNESGHGIGHVAGVRHRGR